MKKITIKLFVVLLLLLTNNKIIGQTVSINISTVNNTSISNGTPINLQSNSTVSITLSSAVNLTAIQSDSYPGTIKIYYQKNSNSPSINPTGGNGGNLLFAGATSATRSFGITLNWSDFDSTGGYIYSEYQTYSGIRYKSSNYPVIKNITGPGGGNTVDVRNISNTLCCNQTIRQGDKPSSVSSSQIIENSSILKSWTSSGGGQFFIGSNDTANFEYLNNSITLFRTLQSGNYTNKSNTIAITVVPTPIISNIINTDLPPNPDGFIEFSISKGISINGDNSMINLNVLQNPFYVSNQQYYSNTPVDSYRWEFAAVNKNMLNSPSKEWTTINNQTAATLSNFNPTIFSSNEDQYFFLRRIATYQNINRVSNELKLFTRPILYNNTICCDQTLKITSLNAIENPSLIIGSTPVYSNPNLDPNNSYYSISYQWQSQKISRSIEAWIDIAGATSKDYSPLPLTTIVNTRNGTISVEATYNYRRIAKFTYTGFINGIWSSASESCYSNEMNLSAYYVTTPTLSIYPNPATSIINIQSNGTIFNFTSYPISIIDIMGITVSKNNFLVINPNLISIDISNLPLGIYFVKLDTGDRRSSQATFTKQ